MMRVFHNGDDTGLEACKHLNAWFRWIASEDPRDVSPPIPAEVPARGPPFRRAPRLSPFFQGKLDYLSLTQAYISRDSRPITSARTTLLRLATWGRALPSGTKKLEEKTKEEHLLLLTTPFEEDPEITRDLFNWAASLASRNNSMPETVHTSFSASASWESPRSRGGRATYLRDRLLSWWTSPVGEVLHAPSFEEEYWDANGFLAITGENLQMALALGLQCAQCLYQTEINSLEPFATQDGEPFSVAVGCGPETTGAMALTALIDAYCREDPGVEFYESDQVGSLCGIPLFNRRVNPGFFTRRVGIYATPTAVSERGYKVRMVTKTESWVTVLLHPIRDLLYSFLRMDLRSRRSLQSSGNDLWDWGRYFCSSADRSQETEYFYSVDWKAASDHIPKWAERALILGLVKGLGNKWPRHSAMLASHLPLINSERVLAHHDRKNRVVVDGIQVRGSLMGDPTTWGILSLIHLFLLDHGESVARGRPITWTPGKRGPVIKGDDAVVPGTLKQIESFQSSFKRIGFQESPGKAYLSETTIVFTESNYVRFVWDRKHPVTKKTVRARSTLIFLDVAKAKAFNNTEDPTGGFTTRGGAIRNELKYLEQYQDPVVVHLKSAAYQIHKDRIRRGIEYGLPVWLPAQLGGVGFPHYKGDEFAWRKRTPGEHKRILRTLLSWQDLERSSPGRALVLSYFASILSAQKKGLMGEVDSSPLVWLLDTNTCPLEKEHCWFGTKEGTRGWVPASDFTHLTRGEIDDPDLILESSHDPNSTSNEVVIRFWDYIEEAHRRGFMTAGELLGEIRRRYAFSKFILDGEIITPEEASLKGLARRYEKGWKTTRDRLLTLNWEERPILYKDLLSQAKNTMNAWLIHREDPVVQLRLKKLSSLSWPI